MTDNASPLVRLCDKKKCPLPTAILNKCRITNGTASYDSQWRHNCGGTRSIVGGDDVLFVSGVFAF